MKLIFLFLALSKISFAQSTCEDTSKWFKSCNESFLHSNNSKHCKKQLIRDYAATLYKPMNDHLREIRIDPSCERIKDDLIWAISELKLSKLNQFYRGVTYFSNLGKIQTGDCFIDKGFLSMSMLEKTTFSFTESNDKHLLIIYTKNGHEVFRKSTRNEQEVILLPNTALKLDKIETNQYPTYDSKIRRETRYYLTETKEEQCTNIYH